MKSTRQTGWIVTLCATLVLLAGGGSWLMNETRRLSEETAATDRRIAELYKEIEGLREDRKTAQQMRNRLQPEQMKLLLHPSDQALLNEQFDRLVKDQEFSESEYKISPIRDRARLDGVPQHWKLGQTGVQIRTTSALDRDIYRFLNAMQKELPGYIRLTQINITRSYDADRNIKLNTAAQFDWLVLRDEDLPAILPAIAEKEVAQQ